MEFICAANWKMNQDIELTRQFLSHFFKQVSPTDQKHFMFFPPALLAAEFSKYKDEENFVWGAQNFYYESHGAYTGENSPELYKKMGAQVMLIGHSERRVLFNESDSLISKKIQATTQLGLIPMLCVGETWEERKAGKAGNVIHSQIRKALDGKPKPSNLIVAYEPVWAIGTGQVAEVKDVAEMHSFIKKEIGYETRVLYGGSVKAENAKDLAAIKDVDGFLIGGASLKLESLLQIFNGLKANRVNGQ